MTLGQRIQAGRTALELSQEGLGEKLGVSRQAVSKWEADAAVPDTDKLIALSRLFGVTLNQLLQVEEPAGAGKSAEQTETGAPMSPPEEPPAPPKREGPSFQKIVAWCLAILLAWGVVRVSNQVARLERWTSRLELLVADYMVEQSRKGYVEDFAFRVEENVMYLDLKPGPVYSGQEVYFAAYSADWQGVSEKGERQEGGNYTAEIAEEKKWEPPILLCAVFRDETGSQTQPLLWISSYSKDSWGGGLLWENLKGPAEGKDPGVADFTYSMSSPRGERELFFDFDLTPERAVEDTRACFLVTCASYQREVELEARLVGGHYTASGSIATPWAVEYPLTVEVVYTNGEDAPYTVPLVRVDRGEAGNVVKWLWKEGEPSEEEPLVAQVGFGFTGTVLEVNMRPGPAMGGWEATFWAAGAGEEDVTAPGRRTEGLWTGELDLGHVEAPCTVSAKFSNGTEERTVPLLRLDSWSEGKVKYEYLYRE